MFWLTFSLFFSFFEYDMLTSFWVVLLEFNLARYKLPVFARPIDLSGSFGFQLYELILGHMIVSC